MFTTTTVAAAAVFRVLPARRAVLARPVVRFRLFVGIRAPCVARVASRCRPKAIYPLFLRPRLAVDLRREVAFFFAPRFFVADFDAFRVARVETAVGVDGSRRLAGARLPRAATSASCGEVGGTVIGAAAGIPAG
jgi:hypothetical protein